MVYARRDKDGKLVFERILSDTGEEIRLRRSFDGRIGIIDQSKGIYLRSDKDAEMLAREILRMVNEGKNNDYNSSGIVLVKKM